MKYALVLAVFVSSFSTACIIGPKEYKLDSSNIKKFKFKLTEEKSSVCGTCYSLNIVGPEKIKDRPYSHGLFSVRTGGKLASTSMHSTMHPSHKPEFVGILN